MKFPTCEKRKKKKIEKAYVKEKQSHTQDNIYVVRQFAYIHGIAEISLLSRKIQSAATMFQSLKRRRQQQNPNHQNQFLYPVHRIHNGLQNEPKNFLEDVAPGLPRGLSISAPA